MGKPDVALKQWLRDKVRFADLFNGTIFDGEQIIKPEDLTQVNNETNIIINDKNNKSHIEQRWRDLAMQWHGISLVVLAVENQQKVNYAMPVRTMLYDSLTYSDQIKLLWDQKTEEEKKKLDSSEFFSHFTKEDKLTPVVTIVFYYGDKTQWDGPIDLHEMFDVDKSNEALVKLLEKYVPNHHINLLDVSNIPDLSIFKSDLHIILGMLEYKKDTKKLYDYTIKNKNFFERLDFNTACATEVLLNANSTLKKLLRINITDGGEVNMCEALEGLQKRGEAICLISQIKRKIVKNKSLDIIADELEDTIDNIKPLYDAVLACGIDNDDLEIYDYYTQIKEQNK